MEKSAGKEAEVTSSIPLRWHCVYCETGSESALLFNGHRSPFESWIDFSLMKRLQQFAQYDAPLSHECLLVCKVSETLKL